MHTGTFMNRAAADRKENIEATRKRLCDILHGAMGKYLICFDMITKEDAERFQKAVLNVFGRWNRNIIFAEIRDEAKEALDELAAYIVDSAHNDTPQRG